LGNKRNIQGRFFVQYLSKKGQQTFLQSMHLGTQDRPDIFDIKAARPPPLYSSVVEVDERVIMSRDDCKMDKTKMTEKIASTGETFLVKKSVDEAKVRDNLTKVYNEGKISTFSFFDPNFGF